MPFSALLDANVLIPNLLHIRPDVDRHRLTKTLDDMNHAFEDALVTGHEALIESMTNHPGDRHVLAAAVVGRADVIVTFDLRDFPVACVAPYEIEVQHPDTFLIHQYDLSPDAVAEILEEQSADTRRPRLGVPEILKDSSELGL